MTGGNDNSFNADANLARVGAGFKGGDQFKTDFGNKPDFQIVQQFDTPYQGDVMGKTDVPTPKGRDTWNMRGK